MLNYKKIFQVALTDFAQKPPHSRRMNFNSNVVNVRIAPGDFSSCRSHSESYFHDNRICVSENINKIDFLVLKRYAPHRRKFVVITLLRGSHPAFSENIRFYRAIKRIFRAGIVLIFIYYITTHINLFRIF